LKIKRKRKLKRGGQAAATPAAEAAASQQQPAKTSQERDVSQVIGPRTIPYRFWKQWVRARQRGENKLLFQMLHEEGSFKEGFDTLDAFLEHARLHSLPSGPEWRLEKIKLDESNAYLLSTRGLDDPGIRMADVELMHLKQTRDGWRLFDVTVQRQRKERGVTVFISFDDFGITSADLAHHQKLSAGYERPDLADYPRFC